MAKDKITDKKVLLTFYQENANIMKEEKKYHNALEIFWNFIEKPVNGGLL